MNRLNDFIRDGQLRDITYRTDAPEEVVHPRVTWGGGVPSVYLHSERDRSHKGFIPVAEFLQRLSGREPRLAVTGCRANGRQTTISFDKSERVSMSPRLEEYLSQLRSESDTGIVDGRTSGSAAFDEEALRFLDGFMDQRNPQFVYWLPRYKQTLGIVREALSRGAYADLFELIWKSRDNSVSNAGQGVMGFEVADRLRERLVEVIRDVAADGSPASFDAMVHRIEHWRAKGEISSVPRLLVARAFAAIHPERYHTTVHVPKQDRIIPWFVEHTRFIEPEGGWATKAAALAAHLEQCHVFGDDLELRNMFPWFVFEQMRDPSGKISFRAGHTPRAAMGEAERSVGRLAISYRHNVMQDRLVALLSERYGESAVGTEHPTGTGGRADAVVRLSDGGLNLYEIKVAVRAADAVRDAMGQLLEYAYRRGGMEPENLYVVAEPPLDTITAEFLIRMNAEFGLKLEYLQLEGLDLAEAPLSGPPSS